MDAHTAPVGQQVFFHKQAMSEYRAMMRDSCAVHATCEDYRAGASVDLDQCRADEKARRRIACPIVVLWGKRMVVEKGFDALQEWRVISNVEVAGDPRDSREAI